MQRFLRHEDGQDVVEYGLLVATLGLLVLMGTTSLGAAIFVWLSGIAARLPGGS